MRATAAYDDLELAGEEGGEADVETARRTARIRWAKKKAANTSERCTVSSGIPGWAGWVTGELTPEEGLTSGITSVWPR
jgi:hypothetical protein